MSRYFDEYEKYYKEYGCSLNEKGMLRLVVILGTKCTLKCKDCNNLIPYFDNRIEISADAIIKSIGRILSMTEYIYRLELIGGEPFLCSNLDKVLEYCIQQDKIKKIEITTNGTVPISHKRVQLLQNEKVHIEISDYGNLVDCSGVISFCEGNKINYKVLNVGLWMLSGDYIKRNKEKEMMREQYKKCVSSYFCKSLYEDKIFQCARAASLYALGVCEKGYLLVSDELNQEKLFEYITNGDNYACDYCDASTTQSKMIQPAIQI